MNSVNTGNVGLSAIVTCAMLLAAPSAGAQLLEEVIVTAQKREQSMQDVGIAVTAFSGDTLKDLNFTNTVDITQQVPSMQLFTFTPALTILNVRGISQSNFQDNLEAPIAAYIDEAYISSMNMVGQQMFDMERVEVLRGPQGTLFGRNATGGVVQYVTRGATDEEFNGYIEASYSEYDRKTVEAAFGGALGSNVRGRIAGRWEKGDGYVESLGEPVDFDAMGIPQVPTGAPAPRDSHGANGFVLRASLQVDFSEQLLGDFRVTYLEDNDVPTGTYTWTPAEADFANGTGFGIPLAPPSNPVTGEVSSDPRSHYSDYEGYMNRDGWNATSKFTWDVSDSMTVESITNYQTFDKFYTEDADATPIATIHFPFDPAADFESWSQELRISGETDRARWTVGGFYFDQEMDNSVFVSGVILTNHPTGEIQADYQLDSENWSIFGQAEFDLTEQLTFIAGVRWSEDDKSIDYTTTYTNVDPAGYQIMADYCACGVPASVFEAGPFVTYNSTSNPYAATGDPGNTLNYNDWAARFQLDYRPNDDTLLFASVNRGIKGGNWVVATLPDADGKLRHEEEVLWSYEVGGKFTIFDGSARLNATAFYYDYSDYQVFSLINLAPDVLNSDATAYGGEVELALSPAENWDFNFGVALLSSKVDETPTVLDPEFRVEGDLPQAPEISFNFLGRHTWQVAGGSMAVQLDGFIYGDHYLYSAKNEANHEDGYGVLNASISYTTADEKWKVTAWGKNLTDSEYRIYLVDIALAGFLEEIYGPPQWFGGTVSYSF